MNQGTALLPPGPGLYYLRSRYYNPTLGRFLNADAFASTGDGVMGNNMFAYCGNNPVMYSDPTGHFMAYMDFLNRAGGPSGVTSVDSGGGGYSTSYAVAQSGSSANKKVPSFSSGKRDLLELWDEIKDDIISIVKVEDILAERYPVIKLFQGGEEVYSGIDHIKTGFGLLMLPVPTPLEDLCAVGYCVYGVFEAVGGLVKWIKAVRLL